MIVLPSVARSCDDKSTVYTSTDGDTRLPVLRVCAMFEGLTEFCFVCIGAGTNLKVGGHRSGAKRRKNFFTVPPPLLFKGARLSGGAQCMFGRAHIHCFVLKTGLQMKPL